MPGFDRTGPMGMGPMTGGARGWCNPATRSSAWGGFGGWFRRGRGNARGFRNMMGGFGMPWRRPFGPPGFTGVSYVEPYSRDQEAAFLRDQATALKDELQAIDRRLKDLEAAETKAE